MGRILPLLLMIFLGGVISQTPVMVPKAEAQEGVAKKKKKKAKRKRQRRKPAEDDAAEASGSSRNLWNGREGFNLTFGLGYETISYTLADIVEVEQDGFSYSADISKSFALNESARLWLGAGPHYIKFMGKNDAVTLSITSFSGRIGGGLGFLMSPKVEIGGFGEYFLSLSSKAEFDYTSSEYEDVSEDLDSVGRFGFGAKLIFIVDQTGAYGFEIGGLSGSIESEGSSQDFSGFFLRGSGSYSF
jgi:hypothetical protein